MHFLQLLERIQMLDIQFYRQPYLYMKQDVLDADHVLQMFWREALHFDHFIVAGAVVEQVGALSEVRHHLKSNGNRCSLRSQVVNLISLMCQI